MPLGPESLSLQQKLAQLMIVRIGSNMPPVRTVEADAERVAEWVRFGVGGLCLFNGPWPQVRHVLDHLSAQAECPLLVGADLERGAGQQLHGLTLFPHAMAFDACGEQTLDFVRRLAECTARQALAAGVGILFGPVADVNSDPRNPIIATRSFGSDPALVSTRVREYLRAAQAVGVLCCAKHFPGHGNTLQDSHHELPLVPATRQQLFQRDLPPFMAAISQGVELLMTAHVAYPELDPTGAPATLSYPILTELLRNELGYQGVVITDSLLMQGVRIGYASEAEICLTALLAGADLLLDVEHPPQVVEQLMQAIRTKRLSEDRVEQSFQRVWRLKLRQSAVLDPIAAGYTDGGTGNGNLLQSRIDIDPTALAAADGLAKQIALRAIVRWPRKLDSPSFRLPNCGHLALVYAESHRSMVELADRPLTRELARRIPRVTAMELTDDIRSWETIRRTLPDCDAVLWALIVKPSAWHRLGVSPERQRLIQACLAHKPSCLVSLGIPYILDQFPEAIERYCTFSDVSASQEAIVERLWGDLS